MELLPPAYHAAARSKIGPGTCISSFQTLSTEMPGPPRANTCIHKTPCMVSKLTAEEQERISPVLLDVHSEWKTILRAEHVPKPICLGGEHLKQTLTSRTGAET